MTYFLAIAEAGSIRGAAGRLGLSVPVISTALAELEVDLAVTLAVRTTRAFRLTQAGEDLRDKAAQIVALTREAEAIGAPDRPLDGRLALTAPMEVAAFWLPRVLCVYRSRYPGVEITINSTDAVVNLAHSAFDLAIRTRRGRDLPLICAVAPDATQIKWKASLGHVPLPLIGAGGSDGTLAAMDAQGRSVTLQFAGQMHITDKVTAREMVRAGLGAALIIGQGDLTGLTPLDTDLDHGGVALDVVMRDAMPSAEARAFRAIAQEFIL